MSLGTEVGLRPGDIVLLFAPAPRKKGRGTAAPPLFGPCLLLPNGWIHQDVTLYGGRSQPRRQCVTWGPSSPKQGHSPQFSAHVHCGQRSPMSVTAEHSYTRAVVRLKPVVTIRGPYFPSRGSVSLIYPLFSFTAIHFSLIPPLSVTIPLTKSFLQFTRLRIFCWTRTDEIFRVLYTG